MVTGGLRRRDLLLAAGTTAAGLALLWSAPALLTEDVPAADLPAAFSSGWWLASVPVLAQGVALLRAWRTPRSTLVLVAVLAAVSAATLPAELRGIAGVAVLVAVVLAVAVSVAKVWPSLIATTAVVAAGEVLGAFLAGGAPVAPTLLGGVAQAVGLVGPAALVGFVVRSRLDLRAARQREQEALVEAAVARERTAMARELHDIAAHHLSGIALMAAVVDRQIDTAPDRAHDGVRQIRAQSTSVLDDLRRLVGLLREDAAAERHVESVATIADLVHRVGSTQPVTLQVLPRHGFPLADGVGPLAQLAAYRTVQEALSNAAVHAPGAGCSVLVDDRDPAGLTLRVRNAEPPHPGSARSEPARSRGGFGLRGMQERADLVGARLRCGPTGEGGWQVELVLVRDVVAAREQAPDEQEIR